MPKTDERKEQAPAPVESAAPERRPPLGPAIISGGCAVAVALITGLFNWINRPTAAPPAATPTLTIERPATESGEVRTASLDAAATVSLPRRAEPIYALNFAAFQAVVRDTSLPAEVRQRIVDRVVGNSVLWQGHVVKSVPNDPAERGLVGTVVLVEDPVLVTQTLQPFAAYCRFCEDPDGGLGRLKPGDVVTIRGDCARHTAIGTEIENCALMETR